MSCLLWCIPFLRLFCCGEVCLLRPSMFLSKRCSEAAVLVTWDALTRLLFVAVSGETRVQIVLSGQHHWLTARILLIASADSGQSTHWMLCPGQAFWLRDLGFWQLHVFQISLSRVKLNSCVANIVNELLFFDSRLPPHSAASWQDWPASPVLFFELCLIIWLRHPAGTRCRCQDGGKMLQAERSAHDVEFMVEISWAAHVLSADLFFGSNSWAPGPYVLYAFVSIRVLRFACPGILSVNRRVLPDLSYPGAHRDLTLWSYSHDFKFLYVARTCKCPGVVLY